MRRWSFLFLTCLLLGISPARAQNFWDTLQNILDQGCNYTGQFNFGSNWDWICTLQGTLKKVRSLVDNFENYAQDLVFNTMAGVLEGVMQQLGYATGGGLNALAEQFDQYVNDVRRAPAKLRALIVKSAIEEAKMKYAPATRYAPPRSLWELFETYQGNSLGVAVGRFNEAVRTVKQGERSATVATGVAEQLKTAKGTPKQVGEATQLAQKILAPKEVEGVMGGTVNKGLADDLVDRAKSAASMREVSEITVEALATILKFQAAISQANQKALADLAKQGLVSNSALSAMYDELVEQSKREADEAELTLIETFRVYDEIASEVGADLDELNDWTTTMETLDEASLTDPF